MKRNCLDCNEEILGRSDKKFCSDQCRNNYNNRQKADSTNYVRNVNGILRKNRRILEEFNPNGKMKIHKDKLSSKGFDFGYFTSIYKTKTDNIYYFCYEQGYLPIDNGFYALVKKREYNEIEK